MVAEPTATAFAIPEETPMFTTDVFELDQVPPAGVELSVVVVAPVIQRLGDPVIGFATLTVTTLSAL